MIINKFNFFCCLLFCYLSCYSQENYNKGRLTLGSRATFSMFEEDQSNNGLGVGGQFRIQLTERVNTEWFADYFKTGIQNIGNRNTGHIGWSVMYYILNPTTVNSKKIQPYLMMGHCFDYANYQFYKNNQTFSRWTSAIQGGLGTHVKINNKVECSIATQYMTHLGNHLHIHEVNDSYEIHQENSLSLHGHLLFTLSINYMLGKLW